MRYKGDRGKVKLVLRYVDFFSLLKTVRGTFKHSGNFARPCSSVWRFATVAIFASCKVQLLGNCVLWGQTDSLDARMCDEYLQCFKAILRL